MSRTRPLAPALGAIVEGVEPRALPASASFLRRALAEHQLLLVRGLELDPAGFRLIGEALGPLRPVPRGMQPIAEHPGVQCLSNLDRHGAPSGVNPDPYSLRWHSDGSAMPIPARYTLLYALRIPARGAETSFVDTYAACAALPAKERRALAGRDAIHDVALARYFRHGESVVPTGTRWSERLRSYAELARSATSRRTTRHPMIREHEETGRPCLFLGDHAWRMTGCGWIAGARRVDELNDFTTSRPEWRYTHRWQLGDLLIWDNRCLLHRGSEYDVARDMRVMLRAVVLGTIAPRAARA